MTDSFSKHWPEYFMEGACLGLFMISACMFGILLGHPDSPVVRWIPIAVVRRIIGGIAMGSTAIALIYSPWGKQSGAHLNPSVTLTFLRLGKIKPVDAFFYILSQFTGGILGVCVFSLLFRTVVSHPAVNYVVTQPGSFGKGAAFVAELAISFGMMSMVLVVTNRKEIARFTGIFAGLLVATYISMEAPISGMSMNPARTFGSAFSASVWKDIWIYFTAPPLGMLLAAQVYVLRKSAAACPKLDHDNDRRCIFCGKEALPACSQLPV